MGQQRAIQEHTVAIPAPRRSDPVNKNRHWHDFSRRRYDLAELRPRPRCPRCARARRACARLRPVPSTTPRAKRLLKPIRAGAGADQLVGAATTSLNCARARAARARAAPAPALVYVLFPATTPRAKRLLKPIRAGAGADQLVGAATTSLNCARARAARAR